MKCNGCNHLLIKHTDLKGQVTWLHFNRNYFGEKAINHQWCSYCEYTTTDERTEDMGEVCNNPQPKSDSNSKTKEVEDGN